MDQLLASTTTLPGCAECEHICITECRLTTWIELRGNSHNWGIQLLLPAASLSSSPSSGEEISSVPEAGKRGNRKGKGGKARGAEGHGQASSREYVVTERTSWCIPPHFSAKEEGFHCSNFSIIKII